MLNIRDIFSCKIVFELHVRCGSSTLSTKNAKTSFSYSTDKIGEYLLILADFYFPMGFVNVINALSPTVANRKE